MTVLRHNWYNLNAQRAYPLDDAATHVTDDGRRLPADILVDCHIRFPSILGEYLFVSAVTVTDRLVTLTFLASDTPAAAVEGSSASVGTFTPVAAVSLVKPLDTFRHYAVQALYPGVGGWLVLGDGIGTNFTGRFSSVEQGMLAPRCARSYRTLPVSDIAKQHTSARLTGLVQLKAGADIFIEKQVVDLGDRTVDAAVIGLRTTPERNVFDLYKGTCGGRPETGTCFRPGIVSINSVTPDCDGNIQLYVEGLELGTLSGGAGLVLDAGLGVTDVCTQADRLPDANGKLPTDYEDLCNPDGLPPGSASASESEGNSSSISLSSVSLNCGELPYVTGFDAGIDEAWVTKIGTFELVEDDSPDELGGELLESIITTRSSVSEALVIDLESCYLGRTSFTVHRPITTYVHAGIPDEQLPLAATTVGEPILQDQLLGAGTWLFSSTPTSFLYSAYFDNTVILQRRDVPRIRVYALARMPSGDPTSVVLQLGIASGPTVILNDFRVIPITASSEFAWLEAEFEGPFALDDDAVILVGSLLLVHQRVFELEAMYMEADTDDLASSASSESVLFDTTVCAYHEVSSVIFQDAISIAATPIDQALRAIDTSRRNVMIWDTCDTNNADKQLITSLRLAEGTQRNGGLIINYKLNGIGRPTYWYASLNAATDALELRYFNGTMFQPPAVATPPLGLVLNEWYRLTAIVTHLSPTSVRLDVQVLAITAPELNVLLTLTTNTYSQPDGGMGIGTDRAVATFSYFSLEEV